MFLEDSTLKFEGQAMDKDEEMGEIADMSGFPTDRTELSDIGEQVSKRYEGINCNFI